MEQQKLSQTLCIIVCWMCVLPNTAAPNNLFYFTEYFLLATAWASTNQIMARIRILGSWGCQHRCNRYPHTGLPQATFLYAAANFFIILEVIICRMALPPGLVPVGWGKCPCQKVYFTLGSAGPSLCWTVSAMKPQAA